MNMLALSALIALLLLAPPAHAFCGFYVAKADAKLFNKASQVVLVRDGDKTVLTMVSDYQGDPKEFALVVPVPTFLEKDQIHIGDTAPVQHLDAYSAPRLVEYFDRDPCAEEVYRRLYSMAAPAAKAEQRRDSFGVSVEASYTVGEYDISILSAAESGGLERWLTTNGYKTPPGAARVLESYIKQKMRFFVAKVNLAEQAKLGFTTLRPIQVAYESPKFMLPIRLGTVNANGPQDLYVYALTRKGRVECVNYRTVRIPSDLNLPVYVKKDFASFYKAMFDQQVKKEDMRVVFLEYAWDMGWCDPCAADPLSREELRKLGVFWLEPAAKAERARGPSPENVFVTRLHVRYDAEHFPEDLVFQETGDRSNFQGRFILQHPWKGTGSCPELEQYSNSLAARQEQEAATLASLTGWDIANIRKQMGLTPPRAAKWYDNVFK